MIAYLAIRRLKLPLSSISNYNALSTPRKSLNLLDISKIPTSIPTPTLPMTQDDYSATSGGALKLKGVNSKISKSHKKKRPKPPQPAESPDPILHAEKEQERKLGDEGLGDSSPKNSEESKVVENDDGKRGEKGEEEGSGDNIIMRAIGKTEAERRHEERRRRRVCVVSSYCLHLLESRKRFSDLITPPFSITPLSSSSTLPTQTSKFLFKSHHRLFPIYPSRTSFLG